MTTMPDSLPNLIIAGVTKGGTTSLYAYLAQHPQVGASAVKETCYFLPLRYGRAAEPIETYREQFAHVADRPVRMESTGGYFAGGRAVAGAIREALGDQVKVVLIFREPVERFLSFFNFQKSRLGLPGDMALGEYVDRCAAMSDDDLRIQSNDPYHGLAGGCYADHLPAWLDTFRGRLHVCFFDRLVADPRGLMRDLFAFAGVDPAFADRIDLTIENRTTNYRLGALQKLALAVNDGGERFWRAHPGIKRTLRRVYYRLNGREFERADDDAALSRLRAYYEPHNAALARQLRAAGYADLPDWLTTAAAGSR